MSVAVVKGLSRPQWEDLRGLALLRGIAACCGGCFQRTCRGVKTDRRMLEFGTSVKTLAFDVCIRFSNQTIIGENCSC